MTYYIVSAAAASFSLSLSLYYKAFSMYLFRGVIFLSSPIFPLWLFFLCVLFLFIFFAMIFKYSTNVLNLHLNLIDDKRWQNAFLFAYFHYLTSTL